MATSSSRVVSAPARLYLSHSTRSGSETRCPSVTSEMPVVENGHERRPRCQQEQWWWTGKRRRGLGFAKSEAALI
ncbi:hypothetical protein VTO73DRAFT_6584 [Trametes versicolor]